jgi:hypothetical protein
MKRKLTKIAYLTMTLSFGVAAIACSAAPDTNGSDERAGEAASPLYEAPGVELWTARNNFIPMCWATPDFAKEKAIIRAAIENTWIREANLRISWTDCPTSGPDSYVKLDLNNVGDGGNTQGYGTAALRTATQSTSMHLGFAPNNGTAQSRLEYLAVHEFGHVLGFSHEQDQPGAGPVDCRANGTNGCNALGAPAYVKCIKAARSSPSKKAACEVAKKDAFDSCMKDAAKDENGTPVGPYDVDSVMSYCNKYRNNAGILSPLDIAGVRRLYGKKHDGAIVGYGGKCLNVWNADYAGGAARMYDCTGAANDSWSLGGLGTSDTFALDVNWNYCAGAAGVALGSVLASTANCSAAQGTQRFSFRDHTLIRGYGGKCLDRANGKWQTDGDSNGAIVVKDCNGSFMENWQFTKQREIQAVIGVAGTTPTCLDVLPNGDVGTKACNGQPSQQWAVWSGGLIVNLGTGNPVLTVKGNGTSDGTQVAATSSSSAESQRWSFRAAVQGAGGRVLDINGGGTDNGTTVDMWDYVDGAPNEIFDIYP